MQDVEDIELDLEPDDETEPGAKSNASPDEQADPTTQAFARLERQMAMMRRAVEHLATERAEIAVPDYSVTLGKLAIDLGKVAQSVAQIAAEPALKHTPQTMAERIAQAAEVARRSDHDRLNQAQSDLRNAGEDLRKLVGTAHTAADQRQYLVKAGGVGVLIGMVLWAVLPGPIARSLPASWQVPERMARRALGEPTLIDAGINLLQSANPALWLEISEAARLSSQNRESIKRCQDAAKKAGRSVSCEVRIER